MVPATVVSNRTTRFADAPAARVAGTLVTIVKPAPVSVAALIVNGAAPVFFTVKVLTTAGLPNGAEPNGLSLFSHHRQMKCLENHLRNTVPRRFAAGPR